MPAVFVQEGASIDYTPTVDVAIGAVIVQGDLVGVTTRAISANTTGSLAVAGVFDLPKPTGVSSGIPVGVLAYWNAGTQVVSTSATGNKLIGKTVKAAADADATVRVRLSQ
jgi:predicted RecA/RadA family phage recombinase